MCFLLFKMNILKSEDQVLLGLVNMYILINYILFKIKSIEIN